MRKQILMMSLAALASVALPANADASTVITVAADGDRPFCSAGVKAPTTDGCTETHADWAPGRWARRHTHAGIPWVQETPPAHGWGVPPGVIRIDVPAEAKTADLVVSVAFGWDQYVPGGAGNDVELHLWRDAGRTSLVASTVGADGNAPLSSPHLLAASLAPGTYYLQEDVFFGEHTWWMTNGTLTITT